MMDQYGTDINTYRKQTFANWITGSGDIDAEWEEYVETMNGLGLEEWLTYKQEAYDVLSK
jgi:putative aldouronate transport system substrate-binding protein